MKKISPDSAWGVEPSMGVSRWWIPRAVAARWTSSVAPGLTVEQSQVTRPGRPPARRPDAPRYVSRTMASLGRAVKTTVDAPATSPAEAWGSIPGNRAARSIAAAATSWTWTGYPAWARFRAIGSPMRPSPTNPISLVLIGLPFLPGVPPASDPFRGSGVGDGPLHALRVS